MGSAMGGMEQVNHPRENRQSKALRYHHYHAGSSKTHCELIIIIIIIIIIFTL
jgi:hypothetical protein